MLYFTQTQTRLTCVASQRSFMSLVWTTAKIMNGSSKGSKAYLKQATAFVQSWLQQNIRCGIYTFIRPQQNTSHSIEEVDQTAQSQRPVDLQSGFMSYVTPTAPINPFAELVEISASLTSFGFFFYPTTRFRQTYH